MTADASGFANMKASRRWLLASPDKVPHYIDGTRRRGLDTPEDIARLATYSEAEAALAKCGPGWLLGFALGPDGDGEYWQGIDLDHVSDNLLEGWADNLPGYVEHSPSGEGVHAIGYGRHFRTLGPNGSGIEAYSSGRYLTFTGKMIRDAELICLADHVERVLAPEHDRRSKRHRAAVAQPDRLKTVPEQTVSDLRSALNFLRADDRDLWITTGLALKDLGEVGSELWLTWSQNSEKYEALDAARVWDSLAPTETSYRAVFAIAADRGWQNPARNAAILAKFADDNSPAERAGVEATTFIAPAFFEIPPRPWVLGRWLLRGTVTTVVAPGGAGKSALMVAMALSLATGLQLLGKTVWARPQRAWLWNLEDDRDELTRQIAACCLHHRICDRDYRGRLFVDDATSPLCTAAKAREGLTIHEAVNAALVAEIRARKIDVLIVDPFVSSHRAEENDNGQIDAIAKSWGSIARKADCSIVLVHHSRKLGGLQVDAEAARGASALGNAARSVLVLNRMEKGQADRFGVGDDDRHSYFRVNNDKSNRAPAGKSDWYRRVPVLLGNGGPHGGDSVVVIECWAPPELATIFDDAVRANVQAKIASGEWRASSAAAAWAGDAVAQVIGADIAVPSEKKRAAALLKDMLAKGQLRIERRKDAHRHRRPFIMVGNPARDDGPPQW